MNNLKFALRQLAKSSGLTIVAVVTLALGIAASSMVFSVVDTALFRPLRVVEPDQLVGMEVEYSTQVFSLRNTELLDAQSNAFHSFTAHATTLLLTEEDESRWRKRVSYTDANCFTFLDINSAAGRLLSGGDKSAPHVVISHRWWENEFQSNPEPVCSEQCSLA